METTKKLPIESYKEEIISKLNSDVLILVGETGCGKSTKIPQYIYEAFKSNSDSSMGMVGITQPRRIAAITLAGRVSQEMKSGKVGQLVGYSVRFDECYHPQKTKIKYLTDGMLLREYVTDPLLSQYSWICLDEAHERTLRTDILFGLLKQLLNKRKSNPLKLVIMSATIDAKLFFDYFSTNSYTVSMMHIEGRQYPIRIYYTQTSQEDYVESALITIFQIHRESPHGDILVFLTGQEEIEYLSKTIQEHDKTILTVPLYAALTPQQQSKAFESSNLRKVILATNIAETSVTIPNVRYVIDTGVAKMRLYHPKEGFESLAIVPISKASARQRCGRAGREHPGGNCYRLYTESTYINALSPVTLPEMKRSNLEHVVLMMKASGIDNIIQFDYIDPPPLHLLSNALEELFLLDALDKDGKLTHHGLLMARFPVEPKLAQVLIIAHRKKCLSNILTIVSFLSVENLFITSKNDETSHPALSLSDSSGDCITLLNIYKTYQRDSKSLHSSSWLDRYQINPLSFHRACKIRGQIEQHCIHAGLDTNDTNNDYDTILQCLLEGFFRQIAVLQPDKQSYKALQHKHIVRIHPSSVLFKSSRLPDVVMYHELVLTSKCYMRGVNRIEPKWIHEILSIKKS